MGKHSSADQRAAWVAEQQASELTVVEFCEWIGVSPNSFHRWRRKLAARGRPMTSTGHTAEGLSATPWSVSRSPELVSLTVLASSVVEIELPGWAVTGTKHVKKTRRALITCWRSSPNSTRWNIPLVRSRLLRACPCAKSSHARC
ncbi:MAG: transposase [Planctomyces sp.]|nr:transposase [Planctomyces sp.]